MKSNADPFKYPRGDSRTQDLTKNLHKFSNAFKSFYEDGQRASSLVHDVLNSLQSKRALYNDVVKERGDLLREFEHKMAKLKKIDEAIAAFQTSNEPVVASDGYTYEKVDLESYVKSCHLSGKPARSRATGEVFTDVVVPNVTLFEFSGDLKELLRSMDNYGLPLPHRHVIESCSGNITEYYSGKGENIVQIRGDFLPSNSFTNSSPPNRCLSFPGVHQTKYNSAEHATVFYRGDRNRMEGSNLQGSRVGGQTAMMMMVDAAGGDISDNGSTCVLMAPNDISQKPLTCLSTGNAVDLHKQAVLQTLSVSDNAHDVRNQSMKNNIDTLGTTTTTPLQFNESDEVGTNILLSSATGGTSNNTALFRSDTGMLSSSETLFKSSTAAARHPCIRVFGSCVFKDDCRYADFPFQACLNHIKGKCRFGERCKELHVDRDDPQFMSSYRGHKA